FDNAEELPNEKINKLANTYLSFKNIVERYKLNSIAIQDWPEFIEEHNQAPYGVFAKLMDDGVVIGCEGDVLGTITSDLMYQTSEAPPFLADLIHVDYEQNQLVLWHWYAPTVISNNNGKVQLGEDFGKGGLSVEMALK